MLEGFIGIPIGMLFIVYQRDLDMPAPGPDFMVVRHGAMLLAIGGDVKAEGYYDEAPAGMTGQGPSFVRVTPV